MISQYEINFCKNMIKLRERLKLTKNEMAIILNISTECITSIENYIIPENLEATLLFDIWEIFGISPETITSQPK